MSLVVESTTEMRLHTPGSKPTVDYCLVGRTENPRQILYKVPVEAKKLFTFNDMGQLAYYMGQLVKVGGKNTGIGLLMDETRLKIAVAPLCLSEGPLPLPIIFLSPSITLRDCATLKHDACIVICVLQQALVPRLNITAEALSTCFGPKWWWGIRGAAERIAAQPQILDDTGVPHD